MVQANKPGLALELAFEPRPQRAVYAELARHLIQEISKGRLVAGSRLPGTRTLAAQLSLQRNTVVAAYDELLAEGWIETRPRGGTFVASELPALAPISPRPAANKLGFDLRAPRRSFVLPSYTWAKGCISLQGGLPDLSLFPTTAYARALRRASRRLGHLDYGDPAGHEQLREVLAHMLAQTRGLPPDPSNIVITRGAQMALSLLAQTLLEPGDVVAVESLGYPPAWETLALAGAKLHPIEVDDGGLRVDKLARLAERQPKLRAVYVTPHHQYPTMRPLAPGRRLELLELAARHRLAIIEDDYDHEIHYEGQPNLPLASADRHGVVIYIGSLSKVLAPGLRLGWLVAPTRLAERLAERRRIWDRQGDLMQEAAIAELIEDGELDRHVRRARKHYLERRAALLHAISKVDELSTEVPAGGLALWVKTEGDAEAWSKRAEERGVWVAPARPHEFRRRNLPFFRMGFASLTPAQLGLAVRRLGACRPPS